MAGMNNTHKMTRIYLYTRYERFWHWFQGAIITVLLITGLEVHGTFTLLGFERAVEWHNFLGLTWLVHLCLLRLLGFHHGRVEAVHPHHEEGLSGYSVLHLRHLCRTAAPRAKRKESQAQSVAAADISVPLPCSCCPFR